jgi:hypothetical protein
VLELSADERMRYLAALPARDEFGGHAIVPRVERDVNASARSLSSAGLIRAGHASAVEA